MDREQREVASCGTDIKEQRLAALKTSLPVATLLRELFRLFIGDWPFEGLWGPKSSAVRGGKNPPTHSDIYLCALVYCSRRKTYSSTVTQQSPPFILAVC